MEKKCENCCYFDKGEPGDRENPPIMASCEHESCGIEYDEVTDRCQFYEVNLVRYRK